MGWGVGCGLGRGMRAGAWDAGRGVECGPGRGMRAGVWNADQVMDLVQVMECGLGCGLWTVALAVARMQFPNQSRFYKNPLNFAETVNKQS